MKFEIIERYLSGLRGWLWWQGAEKTRVMEEIAAHLYASAEAGVAQGLSLEEAQRQTLQRFGPAHRVAGQFATEWMTPMQKILLAAGLVGGIFLAYIDSRPTWDDMGILASGILLLSGLIGLAGCRRPWLLALLIGVWIPLHGIVFTHNFGSILALLFAFVGAYAGWGSRRLLRKIFISA